MPTQSTGDASLVAAAAMTFAASMDEPPPMANTTSLPWGLGHRGALNNLSEGGVR